MGTRPLGPKEIDRLLDAHFGQKSHKIEATSRHDFIC